MHQLTFESMFTQSLPADSVVEPGRREVMGACFSRVKPTPVAKPELVAMSAEVADLLGLPRDTKLEGLVDALAGNEILAGMDPYAACYGGHQFGNWAGQLGDGRAITLGEVVNPAGRRWELQLKGAGPTPYSRMGDGRAVLRSSIREFLCSEAMHHLGVPTTRALSLIKTGDDVVRDMFYNGQARPEPGAIVCRVAPSFLRFGNFEIFSSRQDTENLKRLADFAIAEYYPALIEGGLQGPALYSAWLEEICRRTAVMVVHWMRVGFVHGVMNTDNMSILGLTIDYGPYGWLEDYDAWWTPNTTDSQHKRYRFGGQPKVALWNLTRFAEALYPLVGDVPPLEKALTVYQDTYANLEKTMMLGKLGLREFREESDPKLIEDLWSALSLTETDMTIFFRLLGDVSVESLGESETKIFKVLKPCFYASTDLTDDAKAGILGWVTRYLERVRDDGIGDDERREAMQAVNPKYVLRNYLAQEAITAAEQGDFDPVSELLDVMRRPYEDQPGKEHYAEKRPEWARHKPGCSMLSCSS